MVVTELLFRTTLAIVLLVSAGGKLGAGRGAVTQDVSRAGVLGRRSARVVASTLARAELVLALALLAGLELRATAASAAVFLVAVTAYLVVAIARGQAGEPCACFGSTVQSTIGWRSVARNIGLVFLCVPALTLAPHGSHAVFGLPVLETVRRAGSITASDYVLVAVIGTAGVAAASMAIVTTRLWVSRENRRTAQAAVALMLTARSEA